VKQTDGKNIRRSVRVQLDSGSFANVAYSDVYIKTLTGKWQRVCAAGHAVQQKYWWHDNNTVVCYRLATQLEVALYLQDNDMRFVPHDSWRLVDETRDFVWDPDSSGFHIYLARPEPPTDEELADALEKKRSKRKTSALKHAQKMLTMWEAKTKVSVSRAGKWRKTVERLSKVVSSETCEDESNEQPDEIQAATQ
jgi:hypothetical protein